MKFATAYASRKRVTFETTGPSKTHQAMAPECDVNSIMRKYEKTGVLSHTNSFEGRYADFTFTPIDYQESINAVMAADEAFGALPARVRQRFHNDAGSFVEFCSNPANHDELVKLGLAAPSEVTEVVSRESGEQPSPKPKTSPKAPHKASGDPSTNSEE